jgi:hypothetical protein
LQPVRVIEAPEQKLASRRKADAPLSAIPAIPASLLACVCDVRCSGVEGGLLCAPRKYLFGPAKGDSLNRRTVQNKAANTYVSEIER